MCFNAVSAQLSAGAGNFVMSVISLIIQLPERTMGQLVGAILQALTFKPTLAAGMLRWRLLSHAQVGAGASNTVKSVTGMVMPGKDKEEKDGRKGDDHQDNKAAKDMEAQMGKDPKRMEKMVSPTGDRPEQGLHPETSCAHQSESGTP